MQWRRGRCSDDDYGDGDDDDDCIDDDYSLQGMVLCTVAFRDLHPGLVSRTY